MKVRRASRRTGQDRQDDQDSKLKVQATIQGDAMRVTGAKRDLLRKAIALVRKSMTDYPLTYGSFRD